MTYKKTEYISYLSAMEQLCTKSFFLSLIDPHGWSLFSSDFTEIPWSEFETIALHSKSAHPNKKPHSPPFTSGYIGLISYDECSAPLVPNPQSIKKHRVFQIHQALITGHGQTYTVTTHDQKHTSLPQTFFSGAKETTKEKDYFLTPNISDDTYLKTVENLIENILDGQFYQVNYLRFFKAQRFPSKAHILNKLQTKGEPMSAWFQLPDLHLLSLSPERFIKITDHQTIESFPIKGTIARILEDQSIDQQNQKTLLLSQKDKAELHMIVDLIRNDLHKICQKNQVQVISPHRLLTFQQVHHLEAHIKGLLKPGLSLKQIFQALCPGGSITGAPKIAAMEAIAKTEKENRGYMMGHVFYYDPIQGNLDSSILIRTQENLRYSAGSGITRASQPEEEMKEIQVKSKSFD